MKNWCQPSLLHNIIRDGMDLVAWSDTNMAVPQMKRLSFSLKLWSSCWIPVGYSRLEKLSISLSIHPRSRLLLPQLSLTILPSLSLYTPPPPPPPPPPPSPQLSPAISLSYLSLSLSRQRHKIMSQVICCGLRGKSGTRRIWMQTGPMRRKM